MKCSVKQRQILEKYINENNINILENNNNVSNFINLIINTNNKHFLKKGCIQDSLDFKIKYNKNCTKVINGYKYNHSFKIPNYHKYDVFTEINYIGHQNVPFYKNIAIDEYGKEYEGDYNILVSMKIFSLNTFMEYLKNNNFN